MLLYLLPFLITAHVLEKKQKDIPAMLVIALAAILATITNNVMFDSSNTALLYRICLWAVSFSFIPICVFAKQIKLYARLIQYIALLIPILEYAVHRAVPMLQRSTFP